MEKKENITPTAQEASPDLRTARQKQVAERNEALYREYKATLAGNPEASKTALYDTLGAKYGLYSRVGVWQIIKREAERLGEAV